VVRNATKGRDARLSVVCSAVAPKKILMMGKKQLSSRSRHYIACIDHYATGAK
jgi:hypothetical protein